LAELVFVCAPLSAQTQSSAPPGEPSRKNCRKERDEFLVGRPQFRHRQTAATIGKNRRKADADASCGGGFPRLEAKNALIGILCRDLDPKK
jgi:hypothetical protein